MADYAHESINEVIKDIDSNKLILPAMQRNFVWPESKVCDLFDSLVRNYPIGTFLFWMTDKANVQKYAFNQFVKYYDEEDEMQRGDRVKSERDEYIGVLDGQQRLTSIYLGLCGYYRKKTKNKTKKSPAIYEDFYLCYDLFNTPTDSNEAYPFKFVKTTDIFQKIPYYKMDAKGKFLLDDNDQKILLGYHFWVKVSDMYNPDFDAVEYTEDIEANHLKESFDVDKRKRTRKALTAMWNAFFQEQNINYYPAKDYSLDKVVEIFVRVNSGGQKLSAPDLMLSVATANEGETDIHVKIKNTIDDINGSVNDIQNGFKLSKETFLTAALLFVKAEDLSLSKKENYEPGRVGEIMAHWDDIKDALQYTTTYLEKIGIVGRTLASSIYLIIAYYFYNHNEIMSLGPDSSKPIVIKNTVFIRQWIVRAIVNEVFAYSTNRIVKNFATEMDKSNEGCFPLKTLMESANVENLNFGPIQVEKILGMRYGNNCIEPILREFMKDGTTTPYQLDHIWPRSILKSSSKFKNVIKDADQTTIDMFSANCDSIANIQLLAPVVNQEKQDKLFDIWLQGDYVKNNPQYKYQCCIPELDTYKFDTFLDFIEARKTVIKERIASCFPENYNDILKNHEWDA